MFRQRWWWTCVCACLMAFFFRQFILPWPAQLWNSGLTFFGSADGLQIRGWLEVEHFCYWYKFEFQRRKEKLWEIAARILELPKATFPVLTRTLRKPVHVTFCRCVFYSVSDCTRTPRCPLIPPFPALTNRTNLTWRESGITANPTLSVHGAALVGRAHACPNHGLIVEQFS